ncbi:MAG: coproporphyrinogen dehydrogenase [Coriobacteriales bacterium]|jgi:coproporphyrinogen III oxidase-like Fe-S oxidoreductase|nr:coproporphyrinogen dehydrogenase [Coriobacteriales bacterium]
MLSERLQTSVIRALNANQQDAKPASVALESLPAAKDPEQPCMLYAHVPFSERLRHYYSAKPCSYDEAQAPAYYAALRKEMQMVADLGYHIECLYISGGTPAILIDELAQTIDRARELFDLCEVSCEIDPNHLTPAVLDVLDGRVQRLSVGVQSFDDNLLRSLQRNEPSCSGMETLERLVACRGRFESLNADMIFNYPAQTEDSLIRDLACILESGVTQTTFYPFMTSPAAEESVAATLGKIDHSKEAHFYDLICKTLTSKLGSPLKNNTESPESPEDAEDIFELNTYQEEAPFTLGSVWTFNALDATLIDEYLIDYEEFPAIGIGGFSYLDGDLYTNTFSVDEYIRQIEAGHMSVNQKSQFNKTDKMHYRLMMQLFGLELDKAKWREDFDVSVAAGLPAEYAFFKAANAFAVDDDVRITLTSKGRYLLLAMMREFFAAHSM